MSALLRLAAQLDFLRRCVLERVRRRSVDVCDGASWTLADGASAGPSPTARPRTEDQSLIPAAAWRLVWRVGSGCSRYCHGMASCSLGLSRCGGAAHGAVRRTPRRAADAAWRFPVETLLAAPSCPARACRLVWFGRARRPVVRAVVRSGCRPGPVRRLPRGGVDAAAHRVPEADTLDLGCPRSRSSSACSWSTPGTLLVVRLLAAALVAVVRRTSAAQDLFQPVPVLRGGRGSSLVTFFTVLPAGRSTSPTPHVVARRRGGRRRGLRSSSQRLGACRRSSAFRQGPQPLAGGGPPRCSSRRSWRSCSTRRSALVVLLVAVPAPGPRYRWPCWRDALARPTAASAVARQHAKPPPGLPVQPVAGADPLIGGAARRRAQ